MSCIRKFPTTHSLYLEEEEEEQETDAQAIVKYLRARTKQWLDTLLQ